MADKTWRKLPVALAIIVSVFLSDCATYVRYASPGETIDIPGRKIISVDTLETGSGRKILYIRWKYVNEK